MTGDPSPEAVRCRWCGSSYVRVFSEAQLRELVDEHAREHGGNLALAIRMEVNEKTIRRLRQGIAVESETLMRVDRYYQEHPEWPTRLRFRFEYDKRMAERQRGAGPGFALEMRAGERLVIRRRPGT